MGRSSPLAIIHSRVSILHCSPFARGVLTEWAPDTTLRADTCLIRLKRQRLFRGKLGAEELGIKPVFRQ